MIPVQSHADANHLLDEFDLNLKNQDPAIQDGGMQLGIPTTSRSKNSDQ